MKIKLILAIRALEIGGAERQFIELVKNIDLHTFDLVILTNRKGTLDKEIAGFKHKCLEKRGFFDIIYFSRLYKAIREIKPQIVYTFMPDMNILLSITKILTGRGYKLVWGQFGSMVDFSAYSKVMERLYKLQKYLEFTTNGILSDGTKGLELYKTFKYKLNNAKVIYSGTNIRRFVRDETERAKFRRSYNLTEDSIAIGICSRLDPMKGYMILAQAAKQLLNKYPGVHFFSIGYGDDSIKVKCTQLLGNVNDRFHWLGKIQQPEQIMSGWDIYCSTSLYGEGFSNSIIEAMSCSLPVIATNVGEAPFQVGKQELILNPGDVDALVKILEKIIDSGEYKNLGMEARKRVEENFSSKLMAENTGFFLMSFVSQKK